MSFVRNIISDLVEKRLWPVAIALVAALVAVPIVLGGSSDAGTPPPVAADASTGNGLANHRDAARAEVVSLEEQAAGKVQRSGKVRDPFVQHHQPKAVDQDTQVKQAVKQVADALAGTLNGGSGHTSNGGSSPAPTTPLTPTPPLTPKPAPKPAGADTYRVKLSFGEAGAEKTYDNVARLTPLPSSDNPFFVYLGLADDKQSAIFLVDADADSEGDGKCMPSADQCEQISLKEGDLEFFELQSGTAGVVQYQLSLTSIKKVTAHSKAAAARARARESKAGREHLREVVADNPDVLSNWDYSRSLGLLVSKDPVASPDVANVPDTVADSAAGQAVDQTSTVLTVPGS
jgi:hypothetical protein